MKFLIFAQDRDIGVLILSVSLLQSCKFRLFRSRIELISPLKQAWLAKTRKTAKPEKEKDMQASCIKTVSL